MEHPRHPNRRFLFTAFVLAITIAARAQNETPYVIHAYSNLIQIPVLVLNTFREPMAPVPFDRFTVRLGDAKPFHPLRVRFQGADPINLAILLDTSGSQNELLATMPDAVAGLAPAFLHPDDHVSVYAVDCTVVRTASQLTADPISIKAAMQAAFASPTLHGKQNHSSCGRSLHLYDAIASVADDISKLPGRRVLLVVSGGDDTGSRFPAGDLGRLANNRAVAVFGLMDTFVIDDPHSFGRLDEICQISGGIAQHTTPRRLVSTLQSLITTLRSRYIIEFQRPNNLQPGSTGISVEIAKTRAFIRPAGSSVPVADPPPSKEEQALTKNLAPNPATPPQATSPETVLPLPRPVPQASPVPQAGPVPQASPAPQPAAPPTVLPQTTAVPRQP